MPAAQAVQTVSKAYVDQAIAELTESLLTASGGTLSGPLYLSGDPTQPLQAADKHYVDTTFALAGSAGGREHDGAADDAGSERSGVAAGGQLADDAAGGDERGGEQRGHGDSTDLCGDGRVHEPQWRICDGFAADRFAAV